MCLIKNSKCIQSLNLKLNIALHKLQIVINSDKWPIKSFVLLHLITIYFPLILRTNFITRINVSI